MGRELPRGDWETSRAPAEEGRVAAYLRGAWEATVRTLVDIPEKRSRRRRQYPRVGCLDRGRDRRA